MTGITLSFICGIFASYTMRFIPVTTCVIWGIATLAFFIKNQKQFKVVLCLVAVCIAGYAYSNARTEVPDDKQFPDRDLAITGTVSAIPEYARGTLRVSVDHVVAAGEELQGKVLLYIGNELLGAYDERPLSMGDRIHVLGRLRAPRLLRNPGVYSYDLKREGVVAIMFVRHLSVLGRSSGFMAELSRKRQELAWIIDHSLSPENASLHKALTAGLKRGISKEMRDAFSLSGLAHILSISGTHFGLLAFVLFGCLRFCLKLLPEPILIRMTLFVTPSGASVFLTLPLLFMYLLMSGVHVPAVRAFVMVSICMLALFLGRKGAWLNSLSAAAFVILAEDPGALFELSFILSFLAVLSIGFVVETIRPGLEENPFVPTAFASATRSAIGGTIIEKVRVAVLISVAAILGTVPVITNVFNQFSLIAPVANLVVTPFICLLVLPLGILSGFLALCLNMPVMPCATLIDGITTLSLMLVKLFSSVPFGSMPMHGSSVALIILYYCALLFFVRSSGWLRFLPLALVVLLYMLRPLGNAGNMVVTFLDVGQGDASFIELPDGKTVLIDGGVLRPDMGRIAVAPFLWSRGIRKIDYLVSSHPHSDHFGGLLFIMDTFEVGEVWLNGRAVDEATPLFNKIRERRIPWRFPIRGDVVRSDNYTLYVLHPYDRFRSEIERGVYAEQNSDSLVIKIETKSGSVLFSGDIEQGAENDMVHLGPWLRSDVLKVPHHGGRTSSSERFLIAVSPQLAVVSVGKNNSFQHPHKETLVRYADAGIPIYRTDVAGAVSVMFDDKSLRVRTYADMTFKKAWGINDEFDNLRLLF